MKKSLQILMGLGIILLIAIAIPIVSECISSGYTPELLGLSSLAVLPIIGGTKSQRSAVQIKQEMFETHNNINELVNKVKKEKREFTKEEDAQYEREKMTFEQLTNELYLADGTERSQLTKVLSKFINGDSRSTNALKEKWIDTRSGDVVPVFAKDELLTDIATEEQRSFSIGRTIQAMITGNWKNAENEQRALSTAIGSGSVLVPTLLMPGIIDVVRNKAVCYKAGAKHVTMPSQTISIARILTDPTFQVKGENLPFDEGVMTFDKIDMTAFTIGTTIYLSRELASDAPNCVSAIENAIVAGLALKIDALALYGQGTTEPLGLMNIVGTEAIDLNNGNTLWYDHLIDCWTLITMNNGEPTAYIMSPRDYASMLKERTGNGYIIPPEMIKDKMLTTASIPTNLGVSGTESIAFAGDFSKMLIGMREGMQLEVSTQAGDTFKKHQVAIKCTWRGDVAFEQPSHFAKVVEIKAPAIPKPIE